MHTLAKGIESSDLQRTRLARRCSQWVYNTSNVRGRIQSSRSSFLSRFVRTTHPSNPYPSYHPSHIRIFTLNILNTRLLAINVRASSHSRCRRLNHRLRHSRTSLSLALRALLCRSRSRGRHTRRCLHLSSSVCRSRWETPAACHSGGWRRYPCINSSIGSRAHTQRTRSSTRGRGDTSGE